MLPLRAARRPSASIAVSGGTAAALHTPVSRALVAVPTRRGVCVLLRHQSPRATPVVTTGPRAVAKAHWHGSARHQHRCQRRGWVEESQNAAQPCLIQRAVHTWGVSQAGLCTGLWLGRRGVPLTLWTPLPPQASWRRGTLQRGQQHGQQRLSPAQPYKRHARTLVVRGASSARQQPAQQLPSTAPATVAEARWRRPRMRAICARCVPRK